ncbi:MAG: lipocalin family protein [Bacteroidales bacterium]|nr:lipocalin family protein [Bacteroidales bacterium]MCF8403230.1 lipocalin family protein [Bacteroidales bacterium]
MNTKIKLLGLLSFAVILLSSCSKSDDEPAGDTPKTTTEKLTSGNWKVTAMTIDPGINFFGTIYTDFYAQMEACEKDDLIKFNSNGTITDDEGATKCDANDPQATTEGTWVLSADNSQLTIDYPDEDPITMTIITLNATTFKGSYTIMEDFGEGIQTYTLTTTMSLQ